MAPFNSQKLKRIFTTLPGEAPFAVAVTCAAASQVENTSTVWIYDVSAVARTGGNPGDQNYVERAISVKMGR